jgi:hypothetical protein
VTGVIARWLRVFDEPHQRAIVESPSIAQTDNGREQVEGCGERENMTDFLRKTQARGVVARVAEYVVMLFIAVMSGVSTLRWLGILP